MFVAFTDMDAPYGMVSVKVWEWLYMVFLWIYGMNFIHGLNAFKKENGSSKIGSKCLKKKVLWHSMIMEWVSEEKERDIMFSQYVVHFIP